MPINFSTDGSAFPRKATLQLCTIGGQCSHVHIEHLLEVEVKALLVVILGLREELSGSGGADRGGETSGQRRHRGKCRGGGGERKDRENDLHCWGGNNDEMTNEERDRAEADAQVEVSGSER